MALSYVTIGTIVVTGTTSCVVTPPAHNAGDLLVMIVACKANVGSLPTASTITTPATWSDPDANCNQTGPAVVAGTDTGGTRLKMMTKVGDGGVGAVTVTLTTANNNWGVIMAFRATSGVYELAGCNGVDTTGDTSFTAAMNVNPGLEAGDFCAIAGSIPTDVTTPAQFSAPALTATGMTATVTERGEADVATGADGGGVICSASIDTGPASVAPTVAITAGGTTTNVVGPLMALRIRETPGAVVIPDVTMAPLGRAA